MPTDATFRLSLYLTLALACACVGYAEHDLFTEVPFIAAGAIAALAVLYRLEGRVELLTIPQANRLGLAVGLAYLAWAAYRLVEVIRRPTLGEASFQLVLVALFGPLLMTLMPAKLARREKHVGDFWGLHAAGLVAAGLSGAMAEDPVCFLLLGLYGAAAIWSLHLFHLLRSAGEVAPIPNRPAPPPVAGVVSAGDGRAYLRRGLFYAAAAAAVAVPLYVITPRSPAEKLEFGKSRVEIGFAADQMVDLNQTGNLEENPAPAFELTADANGAPASLSDSMRWRGRILRHYENGAWHPGDHPLPGIDGMTRTTPPWVPPRLSPRQLTLNVSIPSSLRAQILAEPVTWIPGESSPIASRTPEGLLPWVWAGDGSFFFNGRLRRGEPHDYVQVWDPSADTDLSPPFRLTGFDPWLQLRPFTRNPVPRAREYADGVLDGLVRAGRLPADYRDSVTRLPRRNLHERVARALAAHLAASPEFTYTTELRRERKDLDPVEEFLFHTKAGHCERFASALALLLRSEGIPSVLVLGFKGCEPTAEAGRYVVKQEHAHAWVDALIVEYEPTRPGGRAVSRWLTLDPTPAGEAVAAPKTGGGWFGDARSWLWDTFREYVSNYSPEKRKKALAAIGAFLTRRDVLAGLGAAVVAFVVIRRAIRRRALRATTASEHLAGPVGRLLALLASRALAPEPGQTMREFGVAVGAVLRAQSATASVADVPAGVIGEYYEVRFGGRTTPPARLDELESRLLELERALAEAPDLQPEPRSAP